MFSLNKCPRGYLANRNIQKNAKCLDPTTPKRCLHNFSLSGLDEKTGQYLQYEEYVIYQTGHAVFHAEISSWIPHISKYLKQRQMSGPANIERGVCKILVE